MPLELRMRKDGSLRPSWYGRYAVDGKRYCVKLGPINGKPDESLSLTKSGDGAFEKSRLKALGDLAVKVQEAREKRDAQHWVKRFTSCSTVRRSRPFPWPI